MERKTWIAALSDEELATEIRNSSEWNPDLLADLCWRANLSDAFEKADGDHFEKIVQMAASRLGVEI